MKRSLLGLILNFLCLDIAYASVLGINIIGKNVSFDNAVVLSGGYYTPSNWNVVNGLTPTSAMIPSGYIVNTPNKMELSNGQGDTLQVPLKIVGLQYNLGKNSATLDDNVLVTPICSFESNSGALITLVDKAQPSCNGSKKFIFGKEVSPFYFHRPIVEIDNNVLAQSFNGFPKGVYTGSLPSDFKYYYQSSGGVLTYRVVTDTLQVRVEYTPNALENVSIVGDGTMSAEYDKTNHTVSAETLFQVSAFGEFSSGLMMTLLEQDFELQSTSGRSKIPYSIECLSIQCQDSVWVKEGASMLEQNLTSYLIDKPSSIINFELKVHYAQIASEQVESSEYRGNFTVMFEELY
ncbi:TPA: hypothetical protein I7671_04335 [Vibrio vulnificus]|nr:hypothetical protein [Vibrio vulnificus]